MRVVASFEATYPGVFRGGEVPWRYFWALVERMPVVRAQAERSAMMAALYGALLQSKEGAREAKRMLHEVDEQASFRRSGPPPPPDPWEALTATGRRRLLKAG